MHTNLELSVSGSYWNKTGFLSNLPVLVLGIFFSLSFGHPSEKMDSNMSCNYTNFLM